MTTKVGNRYAWKGMKAGYHAKHLYISRKLGKASYCSNNPNHTAKRFEWANISGQYLRDFSDYTPLCKSCHRYFDQKDKCMKGHPFDEKNTYIAPHNGQRVCRICKNDWQRKMRAKARAA